MELFGTGIIFDYTGWRRWGAYSSERTGTVSYTHLQKAETPELFYASAKAFGNFQRMLKDYPADEQ